MMVWIQRLICNVLELGTPEMHKEHVMAILVDHYTVTFTENGIFRVLFRLVPQNVTQISRRFTAKCTILLFIILLQQ